MESDMIGNVTDITKLVMQLGMMVRSGKIHPLPLPAVDAVNPITDFSRNKAIQTFKKLTGMHHNVQF